MAWWSSGWVMRYVEPHACTTIVLISSCNAAAIMAACPVEDDSLSFPIWLRGCRGDLYNSWSIQNNRAVECSSDAQALTRHVTTRCCMTSRSLQYCWYRDDWWSLNSSFNHPTSLSSGTTAAKKTQTPKAFVCLTWAERDLEIGSNTSWLRN